MKINVNEKKNTKNPKSRSRNDVERDAIRFDRVARDVGARGKPSNPRFEVVFSRRIHGHKRLWSMRKNVPFGVSFSTIPSTTLETTQRGIFQNTPPRFRSASISKRFATNSRVKLNNTNCTNVALDRCCAA